MFINCEETPNPNNLKFIPPVNVLESNEFGIEFVKDKPFDNSYFAKKLLNIFGVEKVMFAQEYISVTKDDNADWYVLKPTLLGVILEHFLSGQPAITKDTSVNNSQITNDKLEDSIILSIQEIINEKVRPSVAMDGGDIEFVKFEDGVVYLKMKGACSGCPSSSITLKNGIENMLKYYVPEVREVEQYND